MDSLVFGRTESTFNNNFAPLFTAPETGTSSDNDGDIPMYDNVFSKLIFDGVFESSNGLGNSARPLDNFKLTGNQDVDDTKAQMTSILVEHNKHNRVNRYGSSHNRVDTVGPNLCTVQSSNSGLAAKVKDESSLARHAEPNFNHKKRFYSTNKSVDENDSIGYLTSSGDFSFSNSEVPSKYNTVFNRAIERIISENDNKKLNPDIAETVEAGAFVEPAKRGKTITNKA